MWLQVVSVPVPSGVSATAPSTTLEHDMENVGELWECRTAVLPGFSWKVRLLLKYDH